jgi:hypothetical protein
MEPEVSLLSSQEPSTGVYLSQTNPVHITVAHLSKIHFITILLPTSASSYWFLSFWISHQDPACITLVSLALHMPVHLVPLDLIIPAIFSDEYKL